MLARGSGVAVSRLEMELIQECPGDSTVSIVPYFVWWDMQILPIFRFALLTGDERTAGQRPGKRVSTEERRSRCEGQKALWKSSHWAWSLKPKDSDKNPCKEPVEMRLSHCVWKEANI